MKPASTAYQLRSPRGLVVSHCRTHRWNKSRRQGFTLIEALVSLVIITLLFGSILTAYIQMARQAEWAGYSLAAQAIAIQQVEQARSAVWDYSIGKNEITNLNLLGWTYSASSKTGKGHTTNVLDVPISGTNAVVVTNYVTVKLMSLTGLPSIHVQMVKVDTVWPLATLGHGKRFYTNTVSTYYGPDNRDVSSL